MKQLSFLVITLFLMISCKDTMTGQNNLFVGTWTDASSNSSLIMTGDFSFSASSPSGTSTGSYGWQGNVLNFFDYQGQQVMYYTVVGIDDKQMNLTDPNGLTVNYMKQQSHQNISKTNTKKTNQETFPWNTSDSNVVLASSQGIHLKKSHILKGVALLEFIIANNLKQSEIGELERASVKDFNENPKAFIDEINSIGESMKKVYTVSDVTSLGAAKQELFASLYLATINTPVSQQPKLIQVMNRYVNVLAYDVRNNLVLTLKDIEGMINYTIFQNQMLGNNQVVSTVEKARYQEQMTSLFNQMSLDQKRNLCSANLTWSVMEWNWNNMNDGQKQQFVAQYQQQNQQTYTSRSNSNNNSIDDGLDQSTQDLLDYYEKMYPDSQYGNNDVDWGWIQNMSTQNHVSTMNIIEKIGGTDNYWEVVPSHY